MTESNALDVAAVAENLAARGLNLCKVLAVETLAESMPDLEISKRFSHVLVVGSTGTELWDSMPAHYFNKAHPVDAYSVDAVENVLSEFLADGKWQMLFPDSVTSIATGSTPVPLQKLGALAGWHHPSPLGIGINQSHGLWFAYRAVVAIDAAVNSADKPDVPMASPCLSCETTPCLSHCPAEALTLGQSPDLNACVTHRLSEGSDCASTCQARLACPVGLDFKYSEEQTAYHYDRSRASAKRWIETSE